VILEEVHESFHFDYPQATFSEETTSGHRDRATYPVRDGTAPAGCPEPGALGVGFHARTRPAGRLTTKTPHPQLTYTGKEGGASANGPGTDRWGLRYVRLGCYMGDTSMRAVRSSVRPPVVVMRLVTS